MTGLINIPLKRQTVLRPINLLVIGYVLIGYLVLKKYLSSESVNLLLGLATLPFAWKVHPGAKNNYRYGIVTLVWIILCFLVPVKTLLYFSIAFALLFFTESFYGKIGLLAPLAIAFASPVFQYIVNVFSFPIRMQVTKFAGNILDFFQFETVVKGNTITHHGQEFTVDPACMGLSMVAASFLAGLLLVGFYQEKYKRTIKIREIIFYLIAILLLNVVANLSRIVLVVMLNIRQETLSHDAAGLACLLVYVLIPAIWLANFILKRSSVNKESDNTQAGFTGRRIAAHLLIFGCIAMLAIRVYKIDTFGIFKIPSVIKGYSISQYIPGVIKLEKKDALVYVKYIRGFYDTEHNPMICWSGGGYQFKNAGIEKIGNKNVYTATITNENSNLYTAWWYENSKKSTTDQLEWRWDLVKGASHYLLINVSCSTKEDLENEIERIDSEETLKTFFQP